MATIRVQEAPFDAGSEIAALFAGRTDIGGLGCFVGIVRGGDGPDAVAEMTLEHYPAMTTRAIERVVAEAERRWPLLGCTVIHRIGTLRPGEPIVLVLAASAHRQPALEATQFLIDWLKTRAPFWKRERARDGVAKWVEARATDDEAAERWGS